MTTDGTTSPVTASGEAGPTGAASPATGVARFAGLLMILLAVLQIIAGTQALFGGAVPGSSPNAFALSPATWGWVHLCLGALIGFAGMFVIVGVLWGRIVGIVLAAAVLVASFLSVAQHPAWSIVGIALGVLVVWALCVFDETAAAAAPTMLD
ncbi:DUF7144 family membrane protein [Pseudonocardia zijingensis]|jgi:hypothetical protein|uniref:DUF7144 domain-containing protein n=1 Tax=Pseudonocardia zijingensis TaxID=153376 RepID=A0ABN1P239_9PSEU